MKWLIVTGGIVATMAKIHVLGINGAGILTVTQLLATYGLDRLSVLRDIKNDPDEVSYDEYGRVFWTPKGTTK